MRRRFSLQRRTPVFRPNSCLLPQYPLYDYRYQCPAAESDWHPARLAIRNKSLACLRLAVQRSGPPQIHTRDLCDAAEAGEEMLKYVHGFGGTLDSEAAERAARAGQVGALQCALRNGAPLSVRTFEAAIEGGGVGGVLEIRFRARPRCRLPRCLWSTSKPPALALGAFQPVFPGAAVCLQGDASPVAAAIPDP
eukprot:jgi/Botrbrau1/23348/Bobra.0051s0007.1